jgi:tRNA G18 (ribose-2'-O)-methylase SpoU
VRVAVPVADPDDERIADYRNLKDKLLRQRKGLFLAESELVILRLLNSRFRVRSVLLHPQRWERLRPELDATAPDVAVFVAAPDVLDRIAGFPVHRGALALAERGPALDWRALAAGPGPFLVLEQVGDPDNIGTLFRTAAAFGISAVLCAPGTADPLYRKAIRSSVGWTLHVPFADLEPWPQVLHELGQSGVTVVALTPQAPLDVADLDWASLGRHALMVGSEGAGLTAAARQAASCEARIAMVPGVDSLNVAMAAVVALYESRRPKPDGRGAR